VPGDSSGSDILKLLIRKLKNLRNVNIILNYAQDVLRLVHVLMIVKKVCMGCCYDRETVKPGKEKQEIL
jgi:hypothetical protein